MATSKAFITNENEWKVNGEVGADYNWDLENHADGLAVASAQIDLGARPQACMFDLHVDIAIDATTPVQYDGLHFYVASAPDGDSTQIDGIVTADANLSDLDQLKNLKYIGSAIAETTGAQDCKASMSFMHTSRYLILVMHNDTGATTNTSDATCVAKLIRRSWQGQAT